MAKVQKKIGRNRPSALPSLDDTEVAHNRYGDEIARVEARRWSLTVEPLTQKSGAGRRIRFLLLILSAERYRMWEMILDRLSGVMNHD